MPTKELKVIQGNGMTSASYQLTLVERRILYMLSAHISDSDRKSEKLTYHLKVKEFEHLFENHHSLYERLQEGTKRLIGRVIEFKSFDDQGRKTFVQTNILTSAEYVIGYGEIELKVNEKTFPFLTDLAKGFTKFALSSALQLESVYSQRMFEFLSRWRDTGYWKVTIDEFRYMLRIQDKYPRYAMVRDRILEVAKNELSDKTDISFTYSAIKKGRTVVALEFFIKEIVPIDIQEDSTVGMVQTTELRTRMVEEYKLSEKQADMILKFYRSNLKPVHKLLYQIKEKSLTTKGLSNIGGYTWTLFSNDMQLN